MVRKLLIIGCGLLGSRHLQSFAKYEGKLEIVLVDPDHGSLEKSFELFKISTTKMNNFKFEFYTSLDQIPEKDFDMIIVATGSMSRFSIVKHLVTGNFCFGVLVLEKILFPSTREYLEAQKLLSGKNVYVNCSRRIIPVYQDLKKILKGKEHIIFKFIGTNWGLACNSVHFIDLVTYLTGCYPLKVNTEELIKEVFPSKRKGYVEFHGKLIVKFENGHKLEVEDVDGFESNIFSAHASELVAISDESRRLFNLSLNGKLIEEKHFEIPFQSQMSLQLFLQHISGHELELCPFEDSLKIHLPMINAFHSFYQTVSGSDSEIVPIT